MAKNLNLPGTFNSWPKGPKPPHYAPHGQRTITAAVSATVRAQRTIEANVTAVVHAHTIEPFQAPAKAPKHNIQPGPVAERSPRKPTTAPDHVDTNPYGNYYFALEVNGADIAHFAECSGLKNGCQIFEIEEGGLNGGVHKRPGQSKWENIVLKYATSASTDMLAWRDALLQGTYDLRSGSIALKNNHGDVLRRYHFRNAWPVAWEGPALNSGGSDLAIETLEIAHEGLEISGPEGQ